MAIFEGLLRIWQKIKPTLVDLYAFVQIFKNEFSQSYKSFTIVIYNSRNILTRILPSGRLLRHKLQSKLDHWQYWPMVNQLWLVIKGNMGGSPGLVVMGGHSCSKGSEFESLHHILDGHFFTYLFDVKFVMCVWKDENKWKRGRVWPILKKIKSNKVLNYYSISSPLTRKFPMFQLYYSHHLLL